MLFEDELNLIVENGYYGHPNPSSGRHECQYFHQGSPGPFPPNYYGPITTYGPGVAATGIAEYTSQALPALWKTIITSKFVGSPFDGGSIVSVKVDDSTGLLVGAPRTLADGLANPLDVVTREDGAIFIAEYDRNEAGKSAISVLRLKTRNDFDGDGLADMTIWRPRLYEPPMWQPSLWAIKLSSTGTYKYIEHGGIVDGIQDIPVPADYDGDGRTDVAIWRPRPYVGPAWTPSLWSIVLSSTGETIGELHGGVVDDVRDIPVVGDYDGDGKADPAIWRPRPYIGPAWQPSQWAIELSTGGYQYIDHGGIVDGVQDIPVPGDYDGDGRTDPAIWRPRPYVAPSWMPSGWAVKLSTGGYLYANHGGIVDGVQDVAIGAR